MQNKISHLELDKLTFLTEVPTYVALLIASADSEISLKETSWAEKVLSFRIKSAHHTLRAYYQSAHDFYKNNIESILASLPVNQTERMQYLSDKIASVNSSLSQIDEITKERMIDSYKSLALSIAEIDGGIFNFFASNPEEEKWLHLPMIAH
jgi:hypothetical protein